MPTLCLISFAVGALLAVVLTVRQFIVVSPLYVIIGFVQAAHVGMPIWEALLTGIGFFVCGQLGYVAGVGLGALVSAKFGRSAMPTTPKAHTEAKYDRSAPPS